MCIARKYRSVSLKTTAYVRRSRRSLLLYTTSDDLTLYVNASRSSTSSTSQHRPSLCLVRPYDPKSSMTRSTVHGAQLCGCGTCLTGSSAVVRSTGPTRRQDRTVPSSSVVLYEHQRRNRLQTHCMVALSYESVNVLSAYSSLQIFQPLSRRLPRVPLPVLSTTTRTQNETAHKGAQRDFLFRPHGIETPSTLSAAGGVRGLEVSQVDLCVA
jgi:hypothetical protein